MTERCCPRCAHDFASDAANPACPACGKRAGAVVPRAAFAGIALALVGLVALAAVIVATRGGSSGEVIDAQQLSRDGRRNPEELKRRYHGKTVTLSGVLLLDTPSLLPLPGEDGSAVACFAGIGIGAAIRCYFPAASARQLKGRAAGYARVRGKLMVTRNSAPEKVGADRPSDGLDARKAQEPPGRLDAISDEPWVAPFTLHDCRLVD